AAAKDWPIVVAQTGLHDGYGLGQGHVLPYPFDDEGRPKDRGALPSDLARALEHQRLLFADLPVSPLFVPIDFTQEGDGYSPRDYGLDALLTALGRVAPAGFAAALRDLHRPALDAVLQRAHAHVLGYAMAAAAADIVPVAGLVAVPGVQAKMFHALAGLYGVPWDRRTLAEFAGALGAGTLVRSLSIFGVRELLKLVPVYGQTIGAVGAAAASFVTTFALGKAACYFLSRRAAGTADASGVLAAYRAALAQAVTLAKERNVGETIGSGKKS
ncbi:MAG: YcjF family protein, partial [Hyphomicrobiaceae bacterium]